MKSITLVVAALLLTNLSGNAAAAESSEHQSKHAQKVIATLNSVGINNHDVQQFIADIDAHVDHGYFYLTEQQMLEGKFSLRYHLGTKIGTRQLELRYTPDDNKHIQAVVHTNLFMVSYHLDF